MYYVIESGNFLVFKQLLEKKNTEYSHMFAPGFSKNAKFCAYKNAWNFRGISRKFISVVIFVHFWSISRSVYR